MSKRSRKRREGRPPAARKRAMTGAGERIAPGRDVSFPIVGIGASAGGLEAFTQLLGALPMDTGMGFVLVQHLDPDHPSALTQILSRATTLPVIEITNDVPVRANHVYIIPRDTNLSIVGGVLQLQRRPRTRAPHRPIDSFFESLAEDRHELAVGVVLSGTATDGTLGLEAIKAEGGITFAQDESAKYDSMPHSAIAAGCVDKVLSPVDIAKELVRIAAHPLVIGPPLITGPEADRKSETTDEGDPASLPPAEAESNDIEGALSAYKRILLLLRNQSGVDFSLYKPSTIHRRISRRLVLSKQTTLADYASALRGNAKELDALYADLLIGVTSFFRNPEVFDLLEHKVLPELFKRGGDDSVRCWVLGCSTGQEAYSLAMLCTEAAEKAHRMREIQIFATDVNDTMLDRARNGLYADNLVEHIKPERLRRFFVQEDGGYRVHKTLRELVVFARQNFIADPAFSRMDLISCRNLLIYLEPSLQERAIPTFHYALKPHGFLLLGASETVGGFTDLFEPVDKKHKIYSKKAAPTLAFHLPLKRARGRPPPDPLRLEPRQELGKPVPTDSARFEANPQREADRISVHRFAPPGVLVNAEHQVLQFRGATGAFLEAPTGKPSFDVLKMAREGLMLPLRSALTQAKKQDKVVRRENITLKRNGKARTVSLEVVPLKNLRERCFLILFEEAAPARGGRERQESPPTRTGRVGERGHEQSKRIAQLETELAETREYLQAMQTQHEAANEELQASSEEAQSANEELQSLNEELETSKEELESANEELITVNEEMSNRNVDLNRLNNDLINLQASTKLAIVLLGRDLSIRRFSPHAEKQLDMRAADVGRSIGQIRHNFVLGDTKAELDLVGLCGEVVAELREQEREVCDQGGRWHSLRVRPYMTVDGTVDGAVLVLMDIDALKRNEHTSAQLAVIVSSSDDAIISTDLRGTIQTWNQGAQRLFGYSAEEVIGASTALLIPSVRVDEAPQVLARIARGETVGHYETVRQRKDGTLVDISLTVSPIRSANGTVIAATKIARDISERKRLELELRKYGNKMAEASTRKDEFLAMLGHELRNPLAALTHGIELLGMLPDDRARAEQIRGMLVRQTERIGTLLNQILDIARVMSGKISLARDRVDLVEVVRAAVETVRGFIGSNKHEVTLSVSEKSAFVMGDAVRLTQVVENLLTNAVKYTDPGGHVGVTIESSDGKARIIVRDTGSGISADFLPHVFEEFTQAPRTLDRSKGGLGLGLPLVHRMIQMHGGEVRAASAGLGQGSEFTVTLPLAEEGSVARLERVLAEPTKVRPRKILVVDDEKDTARALEEILSSDGHQCFAVHDGPAALEGMRTFNPEVVLLDLGLPKMDGYEVARRLRQEHGAEKFLLLAVTGYRRDVTLLQRAGFDQHLIKPLNLKRLSRLLSAWDGGIRPTLAVNEQDPPSPPMPT